MNSPSPLLTGLESKSPTPPASTQLGTVRLHGVSIVSLQIDGRERLCLAQISNTLLKDYSYNEIHNRRVALGITCVQCTPVQLEVLRRAGAMPISSRRCGMITKREAERLVKSFLDEIVPPKLPENFSFEVYHCCGWGCRGSFLPSRYNSSRAKCIRCAFCQSYFSPNKFIFHCHKLDEGREYRHPDAANFNAWRRHLYLCDETPNEDLIHAWEDVKAMFNGGNRKRILSSAMRSSTSGDMARLEHSPGSVETSHIPPESFASICYSKRPRVCEPEMVGDATSASGLPPMIPLPAPERDPLLALPSSAAPGVPPWQLLWSKHMQLLAAAAGNPAAGILALHSAAVGGDLGCIVPPTVKGEMGGHMTPPMVHGPPNMAPMPMVSKEHQFHFHQQQMKKDYSIDAIMRRAVCIDRR